MTTRIKVKKISIAGLLAALSIVILWLIPGLPIFPSANFLKYDAMDIPMILAGLILGPIYGIAVVFMGSFLQSLMFGHDGIVGFFMHFAASSTLVLISSLIYRYKTKNSFLVLALLAGSLAMAAIMIPLNLLVSIPYYTSLGIKDADKYIKGILFPIIVPFNLIKASLNSVLSAFIVLTCDTLIVKYIFDFKKRAKIDIKQN